MADETEAKVGAGVEITSDEPVVAGKNSAKAKKKSKEAPQSGSFKDGRFVRSGKS